MPYLDFIDDTVLETIVSHMVRRGHIAIETANKKFNRNVIDPFAMLFEVSSFNVDLNTWVQDEKRRQAQKTLVNALGDFHQSVLGACCGWENVSNVVDLVCHEKKLIAEVKNKHNTIKKSDQVGLYESLSNLVNMKGHTYKNYTAYYVEIIPNKALRYNKPFTPSDNKKGIICRTDELVRQIDGYSFYELATGVKDALEKLFKVLPSVIEKVIPTYKIKDQDQINKFFDDAFKLK